jgi:5-methyltetrahydrofolate--homocysteine methyltransferase
MVDRVSSPLPDALEDRVAVADGVVATTLRSSALMLDDFAGHEGWDKILDVTVPDLARGVRRARPEAGADADGTNTFGAEPPNLADHGIPDRSFELAGMGGASAREMAEPGQPGCVPRPAGPGHARLRDADLGQVKSLLAGGADAVVAEIPQDLPRTQPSIVGAERTVVADGGVVSFVAWLPVKTTGTMLFGSETRPAPAKSKPLEIDLIGLNRMTDPVEIGEHPRQPAEPARVPLSAMPPAAHHPEAKYFDV